MIAEMEEFITSGRCDELAREAAKSDDPLQFIVAASFAEVFGPEGLVVAGIR